MKLRTAKVQEWIEVKRGDEVARFLVEPLTPKDNTSLLIAATGITWERNQRIETVDWYSYKRMKIDRIIQNWEGIEDANSDPLPCTPTNKEIVYLYNASIIDEAIDKAEALAGGSAKLEKEMTKNLPSGLDGKPKMES